MFSEIKNTIEDAINKYKNEFGSFENQISYSNFYNDVKNSKFLKLEDCLQVVYTKITGKPLSQYKMREIIIIITIITIIIMIIIMIIIITTMI